MSKRTIALAVIIGGAWLVAAVPRPVAADGSFPMNCTFSDSAKSTKPLVVTVKLSCSGTNEYGSTVDASLIGPATVQFYSGTNLSWTTAVQVPVAGVYQLSISATARYSDGSSDSGTYVCCSVQAYAADAATPTPQPPPPATPSPVPTPPPPATPPPASTPAPPAPAPTPKPKPAPAATPARTATPAETAAPSPSPTDPPQPTPNMASAPPSVAPSPSAELAPSPPASPSSSPSPAAASTTGSQDPSSVSPYLLAAAVAAILAALVLLLLLGLVKRRRRRRDDLPGQTGPVE